MEIYKFYIKIAIFIQFYTTIVFCFIGSRNKKEECFIGPLCKSNAFIDTPRERIVYSVHEQGGCFIGL